MRLVATATVESGSKLGRAIYNENGKILVSKGITLNNRILSRLLQLGITYIYIDDELTKDIVLQDSVSDPIKRKAIKTIVTTFSEMQAEPLSSSKSFVLEKSIKEFKSLIHHMIDKIMISTIIVSTAPPSNICSLISFICK